MASFPCATPPNLPPTPDRRLLNPALSSHMSGRVHQAQPLHLLIERGAVDPQGIGRSVAIPVVRLEYIENDRPLGYFHRVFQRFAGDRLHADRLTGGDVAGQVFDANARSTTKQDGPLDHVLQFAHVAWPLIALQRRQTIVAEAGRLSARVFRRASQKVLREERDVGDSLAKRW